MSYTGTRRNFEEWLLLLKELCEGSNYDAIKNGSEVPGKKGVAIVPKGKETPQRIAVYPKKTKGAGLVIEEDIYNNLKDIEGLGEPARTKGGRPHYNDVDDEVIIKVVKNFLGK